MTHPMPNRVEIENECHDAYAELLAARERFLRAEAAHGQAVAASTGGWSTITVELPPAPVADADNLADATEGDSGLNPAVTP